MIWSRQQEQALDAVGKWCHNKSKPWFYLAGYAGTGKSTLARHFAEGVGVVEFACFTGKAAHVMARKGCVGARTIHSLIYHPKEKSQERLRELQRDLAEEADAEVRQEIERELAAENKNLRRPSFSLNLDSDLAKADLLIVDECSMVGEEMASDLLSFGTPILVLGDPAQLEPVFGTGFFTGERPDFLLTEIHRQARGNPIIDMATRIREGRELPLGNYGGSRVIPVAQFDRDAVDPYDTQVIVGKNKTRRRANLRIRKNFLSDSDLLVSFNEKIICLRNDKAGVLNGSMWNVLDRGEIVEDLVSLLIADEFHEGELEVEAHTHHFDGRPDDLDHFRRLDAQEFDYGYAVTCHKSQGSQWDDVIVIDEAWGNPVSRRRWRYTAVTRAAGTVTLVRL